MVHRTLTQVQRGANGASAADLATFEYLKTTINPGTATEAVDVRVSKQTVYRDDAGTDPVTTEFDYVYHAATLQIQTRTTKLPNVPASENGVDFPQNDTRVEEFDIQGARIETLSLVESAAASADRSPHGERGLKLLSGVLVVRMRSIAPHTGSAD